MPRHRSSAVPLTWLYGGLIVYASLYPFAGWHQPGVGPFDFLLLGWPQWWTGFDLFSNLVGYLPIGLLLYVALIRGGGRPGRSALIAWAGSALLALVLEMLQNYLPGRVASNVDLALNALGAALGVGLGMLLHRRGDVARWQKTRDLWFVGRSAGGVALLVLWPIGLLFPTAVPFGLGQVLGRAQPLLAELLRGTPGEAWSAGWPEPEAATGALLSPASELSIIVLGLLAPCLVAFSIATPGWRRVAIVGGALAAGTGATTLSTALNFGPQHAFAWITLQGLSGLAIGAGAAALLSLVPSRVAAGCGLIAMTALVMLVARAPADPYFAQSLQAWEQGRFIRFHGAAQWVGWLWPYVGLTYLLARLAAREPRRPLAGF